MVTSSVSSKPLTPEDVYSSSDSIAYPCKLGSGVVFLTNLNQEQGRAVLVWHVGGDRTILTPPDFEVRTTINEYGGKPFWITKNAIYFSNKKDQCLYAQSIHSDQVGAPKRITPLPSHGSLFKYTDVCEYEEKLLVIVERENRDEKSSENECFIGLINPGKPDAAPKPVVTGADFYSNLVFDSLTKKMAWMQWNHPHMPWDQNAVFLAKLNQAGEICQQNEVSASSRGQGVSFCQLYFSKQGTLFLSADFEASVGAQNYWNVYAYEEDSQSINAVTSEMAEFGYPHWQYGDSRIVQLDNQWLVAIGSSPTQDKLYLIDLNTLESRQIYAGNTTIQHLSSDGSGTLYSVELSSDTSGQLVQFNLSEQGLCKEVVVSGKSPDFKAIQPTHIEYETNNDEVSYGFFYAPNPESEQGSSELPPLIVMVHGGPTARAYSHFDIQKQFWLSHGFAILDVNHRGSSGYGRRYRDSLYSHWGDKDAQDISHGIKHLISKNHVDGSKIVIRGKSAGGYAVLRALTSYPNTFRAGASYYGIGNLATLAETTHKFEKHYTDRLVGEPYDAHDALKPGSQYQLRSPSNYMNRVSAAMIIFQGEQDNIVPMEVAQEIVDNLDNNGVEYQYIKYPNEAHGFRSAETNIDALGRELAFYQTMLNL